MAVGNKSPAYMGYESGIGVARETAFGTFITATSFLEFNSESMKHNREEIKIESINTTRSFTKRLMGNDVIEGSVEAFLSPASDACNLLILQALGGTCSAAAASAGAYHHTFRAGDMESNVSTGASDMKSLSLSVRKGGAVTDNNVWAFYGSRVNNLTVSGEIGSPINMTAEINSKGASITTSLPAVSLSDVNPANFVGVTFQTGDSIGNLSTEYIQSFEFSINNSIDIDGGRVLGDRETQALAPVKREVMLTVTQRFDTSTAYDRFINQTNTAIRLLLDTQVSVASQAVTYSMAINLPKCQLNSTTPEVGGNETLVQELSYTCLYDSDAGYDVQMTITNATAAYDS